MKYSPSLDIQQCDTEGMCNDNIVNELFSYDTLNSKLYSKHALTFWHQNLAFKF